MNRRNTCVVVMVLLCLVSLTADAAEFSVTPKVGTLGVGLDLTVAVHPAVGFRVGYATGTLSREITEGSVDYDGDLKLETISGLLDWHPGRGPFRISVGAVSNRNRIDLIATGRGTYVVNGVTYDLSRVGTITGDVTFRSTSPYAGFGWGNAFGRQGRWGVVFDLGVLHQGAPSLRVQANPTDPSLVPAGFYTDLEVERLKTEKEISEYEFYPVVNFGVSYRF